MMPVSQRRNLLLHGIVPAGELPTSAVTNFPAGEPGSSAVVALGSLVARRLRIWTSIRSGSTSERA